MNYAVKIYPVSRHQSTIVKLILRILGSNEMQKAKELAKKGGIISKNLNKEAATQIANQLRELGAQVEIIEMNNVEPIPVEDKRNDQSKGLDNNIKVILNSKNTTLIVETDSGYKLQIKENENSLLIEDHLGNKINLSQNGINIK
ncbi:hypothetical protein [Salinimicrobium terrae]|uniref:hypothetical protein n=1 Tax=Salinimicrobium terrae TaxID=470866 RepID=UPI00048DDF6F|nr:hypothetical protein [Salinimicrobium terrae]